MHVIIHAFLMCTVYNITCGNFKIWERLDHNEEGFVLSNGYIILQWLNSELLMLQKTPLLPVCLADMFGWDNAFPGSSQQLSETRGMRYATVSWCLLEFVKPIVKNHVSQNWVLGLSWFPSSAMSRPVEDTIDLRLRGKYVCYAALLENQSI